MSVIVGPEVYRKLIKRPHFCYELTLENLIFEDLLTFGHLKTLWITWSETQQDVSHASIRD